MHPLDRIGALLSGLDRRRLRVFPDGWGQDPPDSQAAFGATAPLDIAWDRPAVMGPVRVRRGAFTSPVAHLLAHTARVVPVELIEPARGARGHVVLMPSWNDHGFDTRRKLASHLIESGLASVIFDIPHYGERRTVPAPLQAIRTVRDFMVMGIGAIAEARALVTNFVDAGPVGVAGYSMGGNLAALVAAGLDVPVAVAPLAAAPSPAVVFVDGPLSAAVAWKALGGPGARVRLHSVLGSVSVTNLRAPAHVRSAVLVAGTRDGLVPPAQTETIHQHWPGSDLRLVEAGHATLLWRHKRDLAQAVADSFSRTFGS